MTEENRAMVRGDNAGLSVASNNLTAAQGHPNAAPNRVSLRTAIDAMCKSCIYDSLSGLGTWREKAAARSCRLCPLYAVRPLPRYRTTANEVTPDEVGVKAARTGEMVA